MKFQISIILGLVGVGFLLLSSVLAAASVRDQPLVAEEAKDITDDSSKTIRKSYNFNFTLVKDQKLFVEFSIHYLNSSATLKIIGKGAFETAYAKNETNFNLIVGLPILISTPNIASDPSSKTDGYANSVTITNDGYVSFEFMGDGVDGSPDSIWSEPGDYVILIYGQNSGTVNDTVVLINLNARTTGDPAPYQIAYIVIGCALLFIAVVVAVMQIRKGGL